MSRLSDEVATDVVRPSWTDRDDQLHAGFRAVTCRPCGTTVRVRKMSLPQTSVQWPAGPACPFLVHGPAGTPAESCAELHKCIWDAVEAGLIPVEPQ